MASFIQQSVEYLTLDHGAIVPIAISTIDFGNQLIDHIFSSEIDEAYKSDLKTKLAEHKIQLISVLPYNEQSPGMCTLFNERSGFYKDNTPISVNELYLTIF